MKVTAQVEAMAFTLAERARAEVVRSPVAPAWAGVGQVQVEGAPALAEPPRGAAALAPAEVRRSVAAH